MVLWLRHRRLLWSILAALATLLLTLLLTGRQTRPTAVGGEISSPGTVIVLDAGHGGEDGGAVSPDGVPESGINLQIVRKAEGLLVFLGRSVRLTRTGEEAIYSPEAQTLREKKVSDLKNRVALINALPHAVLLSIHQNSMPQHPAVHGAQVFSNPQEPAAGLAQSIQQALNLTVNTGNEKTAKAIGDSVYLMKHITCPGVLVECGFLSNSHEAQLLRQPEPEARRVATALELYCTGSLNLFNHPTNVKTDSRVVCIVLKNMGENLRKIAMHITNEFVSQAVDTNFREGVATWCYFDEFHVLLRDPLTASYFVAVWKMLRKKGCVPSALTQNVKDLLASREIENILDNTDFMILLSQAQSDRVILAKQLGISEHQLSYITHSNSGEGLLFYGNVTIPFVDRFPKGEIYNLLTTRPEDVKNETKTE